MAGPGAGANLCAVRARPPVDPAASDRSNRSIPTQKNEQKNKKSNEKKNKEEEPCMSESQREPKAVNEDGPGINGDLSSWLYVLGGIPMMILFFVVLFTLVRLADAQNVMIAG